MTVHLSPAKAAYPSAMLRGEVKPEFLRDEALFDIFRASAIRYAEKVALAEIGSERALTYAELDHLSGRVAAGLRRRGVGPGCFVGLWFCRSIDLHVALLGIVRSGAAFIPFDADAPVERVAACVADAGACLLLTHARQSGKAHGIVGCDVLMLDDAMEAFADAEEPVRACSDDTAYAIYTSGSTGTPKGITVSQRSICHYLRAGNSFLGINSDDVVLQQASIAFDLSLEEIFIPYMVGATLKVATRETLQDSENLADMLEREGITVIDTVPTLLAMLGRDVSGLRLIILGGEACPAALVERFARSGRRLFNTYGPTETTIVATYAELQAGEEVTIGRPVANYSVYVVDENLNVLPRGRTGELLIGGPGVAQGYLNRPELTAEKFIKNPFPGGVDVTLYRSGDAVSMRDDGRLIFHGRIDGQIKLRGFRIELGEIESLLSAEPAIRSAAVVLHNDNGAEQLVAHLVPNGDVNINAVRRRLQEKLPAYMVPARWSLHQSLPQLSSGKIDRKALALLAPATEAGEGEHQLQVPPKSWTEAQLLHAARRAFGLQVIDPEADFFTELGGESLLAARFVSEVRQTPVLSAIAIRDVYTHRTLRRIAAALEAGGAAPRQATAFEPVPLRRRFLCGLAQALALPFIVSVATAQWVGLLLSAMLFMNEDTSLLAEVLILSGVYVGLNLGSKLLVIALKWLVIGRTRPGIYPLWGVYYFRLWFLQRIVQLTTPKFLKGSPLMRIYLRALGASVGRDAMIDEFEEGAIDLVSIGERASLGVKLRLANVEVVGNMVHVGRIDIGPAVQIGNGCVIAGDVTVGEGAEIGDLSAVSAGTCIPAHTRWEGSPASQSGTAESVHADDHPQLGMVGRICQSVNYFIAYNLSLVVGLLPIFPAFFLFYEVQGLVTGHPDAPMSWWLLAATAWPAALLLIIISMAFMVMLRWILLPKVKPGSYSIFSGLYFRKWIVGLTTESLLETLNSLYATVFMRNWYRLMGAKIGRGTEISASFAGRYDLIEMGCDNFIGDETIFGDEEIRNGFMILRNIKTGDRCFFGNSSVVSQGCVVGDGALIGIKSRLPDTLKVGAGQSYCGSPPMPLPNRQKVSAAATATYEPPFRMKLLRTVFETLHTSLPTAVLIISVFICADILTEAVNSGSWIQVMLFLVLVGFATSGAMYLLALTCKWLFVGRYKPVMKPMWSWWAMRAEAVAVIYGGLASKMLLDLLRGTPFLPWLLRPFGVKIGKGVWLNTTDICEFDCTQIGDYAVLNMGSCPQTHLYEDRIMKVGRIHIGAGVTIGTGSTVLYDTHVGDYAEARPLTLIMKGEAIPSGTIWAGLPAQPVADDNGTLVRVAA